MPKEERVPFYLYIDEFQNFATKEFINTLSEVRKYELSLIMAYQNLSQLPRTFRTLSSPTAGSSATSGFLGGMPEILAKEAFETTGMEVKAVRLSPYSFDL